ncbi:sex peptide receptor-like [Mytilus edulis]|uniref:sex peptide receptor-like n=1 Tax=Mytilus edulis TaxID=6550 RepID=UPI0039EEA4EB
MMVENITSDHLNRRLPILDLRNLESIDFAVPVYGYLSPIIICLTVFTKSFACVVLLQKNMRSPTNLLLAGMAISDMCTGLCPLPLYIYFYSFGNFMEKVPINWCGVHFYFGQCIPTIFHTISIWLTTTLAIQRYKHVCRPLNVRVRENNTMRKTVFCIVIIFIMAVISHLACFIDIDITEVDVPSNIHLNSTIKTCSVAINQWLLDYQDIYYNVYFWFRAIFIQITPCIVLIVLNILLITKIKKSNNRRRQMTSQHRSNGSNTGTRTNIMLVIIVGIFLVTELPMSIVMIMNTFDNTFEHISILSKREYAVIILLSNFFIRLSFPVNFFIYCGMSKQFRETFEKTIKCHVD